MSELIALMDAKHRRSLQIHQTKCRLENELYMRNHPELKTLISHFMYKCFEAEPVDCMQFAVEYFCQADLKGVVESSAAIRRVRRPLPENLK